MVTRAEMMGGMETLKSKNVELRQKLYEPPLESLEASLVFSLIFLDTASVSHVLLCGWSFWRCLLFFLCGFQ